MKVHPDIQVESLADQVFTFLQREIVEGRVRPGQRILEKDLSQRLGVSRTPIREALLKLEMAGVVVCNSRRSYNVRVLTVDDVKETFEILGILEGAVAAAVAQAITNQDIALLEEYNRRMAETADGDDFHTFGAWNEKFHDVFLSKFSNRSMRQLCDSVRRLLYTFPVRHSSLKQWIEKSVREHREIIRLATAKEGAKLGAYFREVHWSHQDHLRYIEDAFAGNETVPAGSSRNVERPDSKLAAGDSVLESRVSES